MFYDADNSTATGTIEGIESHQISTEQLIYFLALTKYNMFTFSVVDSSE